MDLIRNCFNDAYDNEFFDYMGTFERQFENEIPKLKELTNAEEMVLEKYPNLRNIVDDKEFTILNKNDCKGLLEFVNIREERLAYIKEIMFYKGYKEAYYFFEKLGLLKKREE